MLVDYVKCNFEYQKSTDQKRQFCDATRFQDL